MNKQLDLFEADLLHKADAPDLLDSAMSLIFAMKSRKQDVVNALSYTSGTHTFDDVVGMVLNGRLLWWTLPNSFCITEIYEYPRAKHLHIFLAGGDLDELIDVIPKLKEYGAKLGCNKITLAGRQGWSKVLHPLGWTHNHTALGCAIEGTEQ